MKTNNWYFKNEENKIVEATGENLISFFDSLDKPQKPRTQQEERDTERKYLEQLNIRVKCYYDGKHNIIKFL